MFSKELRESVREVLSAVLPVTGAFPIACAVSSLQALAS